MVIGKMARNISSQNSLITAEFKASLESGEIFSCDWTQNLYKLQGTCEKNMCVRISYRDMQVSVMIDHFCELLAALFNSGHVFPV